MQIVLSSQMLWPDGTSGGGEDEIAVSLATPGAAAILFAFVQEQANKIGKTSFEAGGCDDDDERCDAIDLTLSLLDKR